MLEVTECVYAMSLLMGGTLLHVQKIVIIGAVVVQAV
jgi:hypothetical protein